MTTQEFAQVCRNLGVDPMAAIQGAEGMAPLPKLKRSRNKWEEAFAREVLESNPAIIWHQFEGMRFRLADGAYYKPDFAALSNTGELVLYEVKGMWREAARVRIKVAADRFPFRFVAVQKKRVSEGGGWSMEYFDSLSDRMAVRS